MVGHAVFLTALIYRPFAAGLRARVGDAFVLEWDALHKHGYSTGQPADSLDTVMANAALMQELIHARKLFGLSWRGPS